jgi:hypothetical protein
MASIFCCRRDSFDCVVRSLERPAVRPNPSRRRGGWSFGAGEHERRRQERHGELMLLILVIPIRIFSGYILRPYGGLPRGGGEAVFVRMDN